MKVTQLSKASLRAVKNSRQEPVRLGRKTNSIDLLLALLDEKDDPTAVKLNSIGFTPQVIRELTGETQLPPMKKMTHLERAKDYIFSFFRPSPYGDDLRTVLTLAIKHSHELNSDKVSTQELAWAIFQNENSVIKSALSTLNLGSEDIATLLS
jgi:ATP-dependent Clp protease ATP-binding subunit ClpA